MLPAETWMASTPSCTSQLQTWIDSCSVFPSSSQKKMALL